jgi:hypothetical protein
MKLLEISRLLRARFPSFQVARHSICERTRRALRVNSHSSCRVPYESQGQSWLPQYSSLATPVLKGSPTSSAIASGSCGLAARFCGVA